MSSENNTSGRIDTERRQFLKALPIAGVVGVGAGSGIASGGMPGTAARPNGSPRTFSDVIPLPTGFQPEGIVTGRGTAFFVGSLAGGAIYRGDLRTGEGNVLVPPADGRLAVGLSYDRRSGSLFVAGGSTGQAFVYDAKTGSPAATYDLTGSGGFVNDVVVTRRAAYFTDSFQSILYLVPLGPGGRLPDASSVETLPLGGDFQPTGAFDANGIDAPPSGAFLVLVNSSSGLLYRVDPTTGVASEIDLGGETLVNGDGILLDGRTLYVVRNRNDLIAVVRLEPGAEEGEVVGGITDSDFDVPTTVAEFGSALYAVNARFGTVDGPLEDAAYDVVRVPKNPDA